MQYPSSCAFLMVLLSLAAPAAAEGVDLPDGTRWELAAGNLTRGTTSVSFDVYSIGIGCAAGIGPTSHAHRDYLPASYFQGVVEATGQRGIHATACADAGANTLVVRVQYRGALVGADATSVRMLLELLLSQAEQLPASTQTVSLFSPVVARVPLSAATGAWDFLQQMNTATEATLMRMWPKAPLVGVKLIRSAVPQRCSSVGFRSAPRPSWAPSFFYRNGAFKKGASMACYDTKGGHVLLVSNHAPMAPADQRQLRALLEATARALDGGAPSVSSSPPASGARPSVPPARTSSYAPRSTYVPPPASVRDTSPEDEDEDEDYPARGGIPRWRLSGFRIRDSEVVPVESYGASVGYAVFDVLSGASSTMIWAAEYTGTLGIDTHGDAMVDASGGIGLGVRFDRVAMLGEIGLGVDGFGIGAEADRPALATELGAYYGARFRLHGRAWILDAGVREHARGGDIDETRYWVDLALMRVAGVSIVIGGRYVDYHGFAESLAFTVGLRM